MCLCVFVCVYVCVCLHVYVYVHVCVVCICTWELMTSISSEETPVTNYWGSPKSRENDALFPNLGEGNPSRPESRLQEEIPLCPQCQIYRAQRAFEANQSTRLSLFYSSSSIICLEQSLRTVLCSKGNKTISSICLTYVQRAVAKSFAWLDLKT